MNLEGFYLCYKYNTYKNKKIPILRVLSAWVLPTWLLSRLHFQISAHTWTKNKTLTSTLPHTHIQPQLSTCHMHASGLDICEYVHMYICILMCKYTYVCIDMYIFVYVYIFVYINIFFSRLQFPSLSHASAKSSGCSAAMGRAA